MEIGFKDLLEDIRRSLDRLNKTLTDHDKRLRYNELEIAKIKTRHQTTTRIFALLCTACGVLGAVLVKFL